MSTVFASITTPGPAGPPGRTALWLTGAGAPVTAQGQDGDMYLNSTTSDVYGPKSGTWGGIVANIKGAAGVAGPTGPAGYSPKYIVQAGPPGSITGNDGDMYLDSNTQDLYGPKTGGAWGGIIANLKGATGPAGPPGVAYTPRGAWSAATTYAQGDEATDGSILYISLQSANLNHVPISSPTWWQAVASGGAQTPWNSNIDGGGFQLSNAGAIGIGASGAPPQPIWVAKNGGGAQAIVAQFTDPSTASSVGPLSAFVTLNNHSATNPGAVFTGVNSVALAVGDGSNSDSQRKLVITSGGNVGIGTALPTSSLVVVGGGSSDSSLVFNAPNTIQFASGVPGVALAGGVMTAAPNSFWLQVRSSNASGASYPLALNPSGSNVGIGTAAPSERLTVTGARLTAYAPGDCTTWADILVENPNQTANTATGIGFGLSSNYQGNSSIAAGIAAIRTTTASDTNTDLAFITRPASAVSAERMRITAAGNVGIGVVPSTYALEVAGDVNCSGTFRVGGVPISAGGGITTQNVVTGSRAATTVYRNTTGKPMMVNVGIPLTAGTIIGYSDSSTSPTTVVSNAGLNSGGTQTLGLTFWVLPNNYYKVVGGTISYWIEWY
jgi:hypothetical protein